MKILVTGSAGFIGSVSLSDYLIAATIIGIDNHNDYYDPALKEVTRKTYQSRENYTHLNGYKR